jgi:hypothetical protein
MKALMESNPELLDQMAIRSKKRYLLYLSEVFRFSRRDLENAWDLIQSTQRPGLVPGRLRAICIKFQSEGNGFSVERIAEAMVISSGSIEA